MKEITFNDLEVGIVKEIKKWRDGMLQNEMIQIDEIEAGDAAELASNIVNNVIGYSGLRIVGEMESDRRLSEGWEI